MGAPHIVDRTEAELIAAFVTRIAELRPRLVTFNGTSFDLPVLRYRAMLHRIAAPGLACRPYFHRYTDDAVDLCDVLSSFGRAKATLHEISRMLGFAGKASGIDGGQVEQLVADGRIDEVAAYCQEDVVNTYRVWLAHELFCGRLSRIEYEASEENLWRRGFSMTDTKLRDYLGRLTAVLGQDCKIWLIGSRAAGEHTHTRDYDLLVMGDDRIFAALVLEPSLKDPEFDVLVRRGPDDYYTPWDNKGLSDLDWQQSQSDRGDLQWTQKNWGARVRLGDGSLPRDPRVAAWMTWKTLTNPVGARQQAAHPGHSVAPEAERWR